MSIQFLTPAAAPAKFQQEARQGASGMGGGRSGAYHGPICDRRWGGQGAGELARRCPAPTAAAVTLPVGRLTVLAHTWLLGLEGNVVGVLEWLGGRGG
jgi:hypothetical protein